MTNFSAVGIRSGNLPSIKTNLKKETKEDTTKPVIKIPAKDSKIFALNLKSPASRSPSHIHERFLKRSNDALQEALKKLGSKGFESFDQLYLFFSRKRQEIEIELSKLKKEANLTQKFQPNLYGTKRIGGSLSVMNADNFYEDYADKVKEFLGSQSRRTMQGTIPAPAILKLFFLADDKEISLTTTAKKRSNGDSPETIYWEHTNEDYFKYTRPHIKSLYKKVMSPSLKNEHKIRELVGRMHWWLAHETYYKKGSSAIADYVTKAILAYKGLENKAWKPGFAPDIEAFITDEETYAKKYAAGEYYANNGTSNTVQIRQRNLQAA